MKRYLLKCAALAAAVAAPFVLWFWYVMALPDPMGGSIAATIRYKTQLIRTTPGPRVILAGGSSSPYGTNCRMAADRLGVEVINVGATAYLGLDFYLNYLELYTREGDVVVFAPEYTLLTDGEGDYSLVWMGAGNDPAVWRAVPLRYYPGLYSTVNGYYRLKKENTPTDGSFVPLGYNEAFGPLGDVTMHRESVLEQGYNTQELFDMTPAALRQENLNKINRTARMLRRKGVKMVFAFAPFAKLAVSSSPADTAAYAQAVEDALEIPVILSLESAAFEGQYMYDSNNHLTTAGAALYTQSLIEGLQPCLDG